MKVVIDGLQVLCQFPAPPPPPLVSLEVQLVNNKLGDVFLHVTQLDSYIASIQRGKCNALDCIEKMTYFM